MFFDNFPSATDKAVRMAIQFSILDMSSDKTVQGTTSLMGITRVSTWKQERNGNYLLSSGTVMCSLVNVNRLLEEHIPKMETAHSI